MKIHKDMIDITKLSKKVQEEELEYVYHRHQWQDKNPHWDIRIKMSPYELFEFNLWDDIIKTETCIALPKISEDVTWFMHRGQGLNKPVGKIPSKIWVLDYGYLIIKENEPLFKSFQFRSTGIFEGNRLNGLYSLVRKSDSKWYFEKSNLKKDEEEHKELDVEDKESLLDLEIKIKKDKLLAKKDKLLTKWLEETEKNEVR